MKEYWEKPKVKIEPNDWFGSLELEYTKAETCLKKVIACAKKDLKV